MEALIPDEREAKFRALPVKADAAIKTGDAVIFNGTVAEAATTAAGRDAFTARGVAEESATGGAADGAVKVTVRSGTFLFTNSDTDPVTLADLGSTVFAEDARTAARTSNTNTCAALGILFDVDDAGAWVTL